MGREMIIKLKCGASEEFKRKAGWTNEFERGVLIGMKQKLPCDYTFYTGLWCTRCGFGDVRLYEKECE